MVSRHLRLTPGSGTHTVCWSDVEGYITPACRTVGVSFFTTTTVVGTFVPNGYLHVTTSPSTPGTIYVDGFTRDDSGMFTDLAVGAHQVCFGKVTGLSHTPPCQNVTLTAGNTTAVTGAYS